MAPETLDAITPAIDERLAVLEAEVARLRDKVGNPRQLPVGKTSSDFLNTMFGIHANSLLIEEGAREVEAEREREREAVRQTGASGD